MGEFFSSINETVNPAHTAVVVVDMQNDFCAENGDMHKRLGGDMSSNFSLAQRIMGLVGAALHFDIWVPNFGVQEYMRHTEETDAVFRFVPLP